MRAGNMSGFQFRRMKFQLVLLQTLVMFNSCFFFHIRSGMVELRGIHIHTHINTHTYTHTVGRNTCCTIAVTRSTVTTRRYGRTVRNRSPGTHLISSSMHDRIFASRHHTVPYIPEAFRGVQDFTGEINSALSLSFSFFAREEKLAPQLRRNFRASAREV